MQLGKTLLGALIGGAIGIAALIAIQYFTGWDNAPLAILVALLTGLGVRLVVATHGHPSYVRGAFTGILALAAYWGGTQIFSELMTRGILQQTFPGLQAAEAAVQQAANNVESDPTDIAEVEAASQPEKPADERRERSGAPAGEAHALPRRQNAPTAWDYVWLTVAALLAYELGRGSSDSRLKEPVVPPPDAT